MPDYTSKGIDEMEAIFHGSFRRAGAELKVESFGMQIFDMPPNADRHPEHDHTHDGQEEVYIALKGSGMITIDGETLELDTDHPVRVGPSSRRRLVSGPDGMRVLALGGCPGKVYERPAPFKLGAPDPTATS